MKIEGWGRWNGTTGEGCGAAQTTHLKFTEQIQNWWKVDHHYFM